MNVLSDYEGYHGNEMIIRVEELMIVDYKFPIEFSEWVVMVVGNVTRLAVNGQ